jgi:catecholate siderophore receptor
MKDYIKSRKHPPRSIAPSPRISQTALALMTMALPGLPTAALAQETVLPEVNVTATGTPYKPETVGSPKYTEPLRDTPQTVTVIPKEVIADQNLMTLREILSTVPGITFGAGEGGGGVTYDNITFRGMPSNDDITTDGVRDSARVARSDPFNLEQVEVFNGASSVNSGAGAVGGSINLSTKTARAGNFANVSGGLGTDSYGRVTADVNRQINDGIAVRLNLMHHQNDVPGRDYENMKRWGVAPSVVFGLGTPTRFSLSYLHQEDDNIPQYGVPYYNGGPLPGVDRENYYGYHNVDTQEIKTDALTGRFEHAFNDNLSLRNQTRWQKTTQFSIVNPPQGTWCLASGLTPTGAACGTTAPGFYTPSGPRGTTRDTTNTVLSNQTDVTALFNTGGIQHTLVAGLSFTRETYKLVNGNSQTGPYPPMSIHDPESVYHGVEHFNKTGKTTGETDNRALYAFDTLKLTPQWLVTAGLRYEHNDGESRTDNLTTGVRGTTFKNDDNLFSWRAGLVFKPVENGSIYLAYANSRTPSKSSVNGACSAATCEVDPETAELYELGTKWDVLDNRLALTASVFRNERTNYKVADAGNPDNPSGEQQLDGTSRVDGIALGASGQITDKWSVFANYTYLKSKVLQGVSDYNATLGTDYAKGDELTQTPKHAFSLWTTYELPAGWRIGYGATYQGETYLNQHNAANPHGPLLKSDSYWVQRLMVGYRVNRQLNVQLNVNNLFDKEYYLRIRSNGWAVPGDGRSAVLSATYSF